jgi:hypothetical protein
VSTQVLLMKQVELALAKEQQGLNKSDKDTTEQVASALRVFHQHDCMQLSTQISVYPGLTTVNHRDKLQTYQQKSVLSKAARTWPCLAGAGQWAAAL